jgi:hypothetical protein
LCVCEYEATQDDGDMRCCCAPGRTRGAVKARVVPLTTNRIAADAIFTIVAEFFYTQPGKDTSSRYSDSQQ